MSLCWFWEKIFLTYRSQLWQWEQRWLPDRDSDQNSSVGCHKFNLNLYPVITWLENRENRDFLFWIFACLSWVYLLTSVSVEYGNKWMIKWTWESKRRTRNHYNRALIQGSCWQSQWTVLPRNPLAWKHHGLTECPQLIKPQTKEET